MPLSKKQRRVYKRAARIRKSIREDRSVSVENLEWLKKYDAAKIDGSAADDIEEPGAGPAENQEDDGDDAAPSELDDSDELTDPTGEAPEVPHNAPVVDDIAPPPPPVPRMDIPRGPRIKPGAPPRVRLSDGDSKDGKGRGEKWQAKYKSKGDDRERTVEFVADYWLLALRVMSAELKAIGQRPMIDCEKLRGPIMLTVDEFMPAVSIKPEHEAVGMSTVLLAQRFYHRKAIGEKANAMKAKTATEQRTAERKTRVEDMQSNQTNDAPTQHTTADDSGGFDVAHVSAAPADHVEPIAPPDAAAYNGLKRPMTREDMRLASESLGGI